jgi:uncharacterized protein (TIGR03067 family)
MRKLSAAVALIALVSTVQAARAGTETVAEKSGGPSTRPTVAALRQERIESAKKAMDTARKMWQVGQLRFDEVGRWSRRWSEARLEAAGNDAERTAILQELVELAKSEEAQIDGQYRAGISSSLDAEAAHYFRIETELKLARHLAQAEARANDGKQLLQGTWKVVKKVKNGEPEALKAAPTTLKFSGETITLSEGGEQKSQGTFTIDESKTPRHITLTGTTGQNAGRTFEGIYQLEADTFKLAYSIGDNAGAPPKDFAGGQGQAVEVLERQKP